MTKGFNTEGDNKVRVNIHLDEINNLVKKYKKIKKYQKSSLFAIHEIDGTETYVDRLLNEVEDSDETVSDDTVPLD